MICQADIPARHACAVLDISKSTYYEGLKKPSVNLKDLPLKHDIYDISLEYPKYGYRRIAAELRRNGSIVNRKKVLKIMREENLLCVPKKKFRVTTTNSNHNYLVYPNLTRDLEVTRLNQLWVADITYVHLLHECVYVAVIIDVHSRKCIGWELSRRIDTNLVLNALNMAVDARTQLGMNGLTHHSDQGVQYACHEYINRLKELGIQVSMSRKGNPYDNAFAESFMKTLKAEEVYLKEYKTYNEAYDNIKQFIEIVYNNKRLHSSIGYIPPIEFEAKALNISLS